MRTQLTLDICNALLKNLLQCLGVLQLLCNFSNDGISELFLLSLLHLALVSYPRIKHRLSFRSQRSLLFKLICLGFKLGCLLVNI